MRISLLLLVMLLSGCMAPYELSPGEDYQIRDRQEQAKRCEELPAEDARFACLKRLYWR